MLKKKSIFIGFGLVIAVAAAGLIMTAQFFNTPGISLASLFNAGMDVLGAFVCAVLFYGCMGQVENSTRSFSLLVLMTSASFFINEVMWLTAGIAEWRILYFACCILSKWLNLAMIFFFYTYVKQTLGFGGKLVRTADRLLPALLIASMADFDANWVSRSIFAVKSPRVIIFTFT